jgi:hypothetical protein
MGIDWERKLSSRKFWAAIIGWLTSLLTAFGIADNTIAQVSIIISGIAALAVYMLAEGMADAAYADEKQDDFKEE